MHRSRMTLPLLLLGLSLSGTLASCERRDAEPTASGPAAEGGPAGAPTATHPGSAVGDPVAATSTAAPTLPVAIAPGEAMTADFDDETEGQPPADFAPLVGRWLVGAGEAGSGLICDGTAGPPAAAPDLAALAEALFGTDGSLLTAAVKAAPLYAFSAYRPLARMANGQVSVRFKPDGSGDQAAGIVFALRANGDYLVARANGPEHNLVLLSLQGGRRNLVAKQTDVAVTAASWHALTLTVAGGRVTAQVDDQPALQVVLPGTPAGRVGLWCVSDRAVGFDGFSVEGGP